MNRYKFSRRRLLGCLSSTPKFWRNQARKCFSNPLLSGGKQEEVPDCLFPFFRVTMPVRRDAPFALTSPVQPRQARGQHRFHFLARPFLRNGPASGLVQVDAAIGVAGLIAAGGRAHPVGGSLQGFAVRVKQWRDPLLERCRRQPQRLRRLPHPHRLKSLGLGEDEGRFGHQFFDQGSGPFVLGFAMFTSYGKVYSRILERVPALRNCPAAASPTRR